MIVATTPFAEPDVRKAISDIPEATVTDNTPKGLVVVTESADLRRERDLFESIERLPGVRKVDLIFSNFEDDAPEDTR
jgi:nitrate reductase NapAB chaperone NapD